VKLSFTVEASRELDDAIAYYEAKSPGLGLALAAEAEAAGHRIVAHPRAWHALDDNIRRCQFNRFPYSLIYAVEGDTALVLAVMHLHRLPEYWRDRPK
jgi:plasmid stabilization system protein ParE